MSGRLLTPDFLRIVAAHALSALGWSTMLLLPLYLAHLGASRARIGAVMASAALSGLFARPAVGMLLDAWGRRPVVAVGSALQALGMAAILFVDAPDWRAFAARAVFGLGTAAVFTGYFTLATDLVPRRRRTEGIALFGISGLVPLVVNPLAQTLGVAGADVRVFLPAMAVVVLCSLLPLRHVREPMLSAATRPRPIAILRALARRPLWPAWCATLSFATLVVIFQAFAAVTAEGRGVARPSDVWLTYAVGAIGIRLFGARLPDRVGTRNLIAPSVALLAGGVLALATASSAAHFLVAGALGGLGHGMGFPVLTSQVATRSPAHVRGSALAGFTGLWDCSFLVAPPLLGLLADARGDALMLATAALLAAVALVVWLAFEALVGDERSPDDGADAPTATAATAATAATP